MKKSASEMAKVALTRWQKELNLNDIDANGKMFGHPSLTPNMQNAMTQQMAMNSPKGVYKNITSLTPSPESLADTLLNERKGSWLSTLRHRLRSDKDPLANPLITHNKRFQGKPEGINYDRLSAYRDKKRTARLQQQQIAREEWMKQERAALDKALAVSDAKGALREQNPGTYLSTGTKDGKNTLKRPYWLSADEPIPARVQESFENFRASKAAPVAAAPAVAEAATTGAEAAAKAAPAVSKLNPKLLRNLGIGGAAVGALGLGGYGLYQAAKGNKKPEEQPLKKSAGDYDRWDPRAIGFMSSIPYVGITAGPVTAAIGAPLGKKTRAGLSTLVGTAGGALGGSTLGAGLGMLGDALTRNRLGRGRLEEALGLLGSIVGAGGGGALGYNYATHTTKKALPKEAAYVSKESQADMRKSAAEIAEKVCTPEEKAKCCEGESSKKDEKKDEKKSEGNPFVKKDEGNPFEKKEAASCSSSSPKPKKMKKSPKEIANKVWSSKKK